MSIRYILLTVAVAAPLAASEPMITSRGPHHRVWEWVEEKTWPDGRVMPEKHSYTELATGMHFWDHTLGWVESQETFTLLADGAAALDGPQKLVCGPNLNDAMAIAVVLPDGQRMNSTVLGLAYLDTATGQSQVIARLKDCAGELHLPNQILYPDAFDGVRADVRVTYRRHGLEQDIILRPTPAGPDGTDQAPIVLPDPAQFGMNPETVRLESWTAFTESAVPLEKAGASPSQPGAAEDEPILTFGPAHIGVGRAFLLPDGQAGHSIPVRKNWVRQQNGPQILIESIPYPAIREYLAPSRTTASLDRRFRSGMRTAPTRLAKRSFPPIPPHQAKRSQRIRLAALPQPTRGLCMDYPLNGSFSNWVFAADTTYVVSGPVHLTGPSNILESTVIKFSKNVGATICVQGTLISQTDLTRPAVLTASDDATVGEGGGAPSGTYAAIALDFASTNSAAALQNLRIAYATKALRFNNVAGHELRHVQIYNCGTAVDSAGADYAMRNALVWNVTNAASGSGTGRWEHATFDQVTNLATGVGLCLTNCLLTGVVNTNGLTGVGNCVLSSSNGVYKTVGGGKHYLAQNSPYRDAGVSTVNNTLANELKIRTTCAPLILSNVNVDTTLSPIAGRDTDTLDLGFHYAPLDYWVSGVTLNSNVTLLLTNGVAVGVDYAASAYGFYLKSARFVSEGTPLASNRLVRAHTIQEQGGGNPGTRSLFHDLNSSDATCEVRLRWTEFAQLANDGYIYYSGTHLKAMEWSHCRIYNPSLTIVTSGANTMSCGMTNCFCERGGVQYGYTSPSSLATVHVRNCLFRPCSLFFVANAVNSWTVQDNLFEGCKVNSAYGAAISNSYNAFYLATNQLSAATPTNYVLTNLVYVAGPLGNFYQPTNSFLIDRGGTNAGAMGLHHYATAMPTQQKESNSIVDIGIHWIAVDGDGRPLDSDGDSLWDYREDVNGNGLLDSGETRSDDANDPGLWVRIFRPAAGTQLP